jgi:hypothetical protein
MAAMTDMTLHKISLVLAALFLIAATAPAPAADLLDNLRGSFRGSGWGVRTPDAGKETIRCKLDGSYTDATGRTTFNGRCAAPGNKFAINGYIRKSSVPGRYVGRWANPYGIGEVSVSGKAQGNTIVLTYDAQHPDTGKEIEGRIRWTISASGFSIESSAREVATGKSWTSGNLKFTR